MSRKTILVVDDDQEFREVVCDFLRTMVEDGIVLKEAEDGRDALEKFDGTVVLVISDLNMPRMRGVDLLQKLRDQGREVPFLLWSSVMDHSTAEEDRKKAEGLKAVCFKKPIDWERDWNMIEGWITLTIQSSITDQSPAKPR